MSKGRWVTGFGACETMSDYDGEIKFHVWSYEFQSTSTGKICDRHNTSDSLKCIGPGLEVRKIAGCSVSFCSVTPVSFGVAACPL